MEDNFAIQLFEGNKVRIVWDEEQEKYYFSVVDIVQVLTGSFDYQQARKYWKVLKGRLIKEGNETVTNCYQLKLPAADGKKRLTDMADLQGIFRIIQSVPSKKAEPVKQWLAQLGQQRIEREFDIGHVVAQVLLRQSLVALVLTGSHAAPGLGKYVGQDGKIPMLRDACALPFVGQLFAHLYGTHALVDPLVVIALTTIVLHSHLEGLPVRL